ncbi:MAG: trigger factor [Verrucomicrobiales bacterium]|nr:trigger factor [Verrucomicrobiales bacterium]
MNVSVEQLAPCKVLMKIEVDAAIVDKAFEQATADYQRQAKMTGFRPGKAPAYLVTRTFGREIEQEVKRRLVSDGFRDAVKDKGLRVLGQPDIEEIQFGRGQSFQFAATLETEPTFETPDYKGIPVEVETRSVTSEDVDRAITAVREQRGNFLDVQRAVGAGDFVVVNYQGSCEGKPITEHSPTARGLTEQKNFWLKVETEHFIPGFTDQLIGASAGDKRTVQVTFPPEFVVPALVGKAGVYEVEVLQVKERRLPELDEEFAKQFGVESLEALREGVKSDLDNELKHKRVTAIRNQLVKALLDRVQCELPESVVQHETRNVIRDIVSQNQRRGVTKEAIQEHKDEIFSAANTSAKDRVKAALILNRIAEKEGIKVQDQEILQRIAMIAQQRKERPEKVLREMQQNGQINALAEQILTGKVLDYLQLQALISEVPARPEGAPAA